MKPSSQSQQTRNRAEWVTLAIALFIVAVLIGLILHIWITEDNRLPIIAVTSRPAILEVRGQYYVPFTVTNVGGGTADTIQVVAELKVNGEIVESGAQTFSFLSKNEREEGAFIFTQDPRQADLTVRAASYSLP